MAAWKDVVSVAIKAVLGLAILAAAICSILALVNVLSLRQWLDPAIQGPGLVLPGKNYFIAVPINGTVTQVRSCVKSSDSACLAFNFNEFDAPATGVSYASPTTAVRFVRAVGGGAGSPLKYGDVVNVFFVQQGMWFTGTGKMISPRRADAAQVPLTCPVWTENGNKYTQVDPNGYVTTSSLVNFDTQADNAKGVTTHVALTGSTNPAFIGEFVQ